MGTKRQRWLAVAVLLIVVAGQAVAALAGQQQYIVKTKHLVAQPHGKAAPSVQDVVRASGGRVDYKWRDRLVVTLAEGAVQALTQNPGVEFVQKVTSGISEGGSAAAESADSVVTSLAFRPAAKSLPPWTSGTYSYDGEGNITAIGSNAYSYDAFSRLATSTTNGIPETYTYDRYGNLTQKRTGTGSTVLIVESDVDSGNHVNGHCYDPAGNLTDDAGVNCPTATETHSFDALNMMMMKWNRSASTKEYYIYNANDERIAVIPCSGTVCTDRSRSAFAMSRARCCGSLRLHTSSSTHRGHGSRITSIATESFWQPSECRPKVAGVTSTSTTSVHRASSPTATAIASANTTTFRSAWRPLRSRRTRFLRTISTAKSR
jgi:YD repeat-containing protein